LFFAARDHILSDVEGSMRPVLLPGPFSPPHEENRMHHEGDVEGARTRFLARRFRNLDALLKQRYAWMNDHIHPGDKVVEFGCGAGFSRLFIEHDDFLLTDYVRHPWVDVQADALDPPFEPGSIDVIICSHMIHHMASPVAFFAKAHALLRPQGRILIQEINTALLMRALLRAMRHEGWSYDIDVFDASAIANDPKDPWSANCAVPEMLFARSDVFERRVQGYTIVKNELNESLLFPLSGGVIARAPVPELPGFLLSAVRGLDRILVAAAPGVFAFGRSVVLRKAPLQ
jgi:SAM-dependent methyltransferase